MASLEERSSLSVVLLHQNHFVSSCGQTEQKNQSTLQVFMLMCLGMWVRNIITMEEGGSLPHYNKYEIITFEANDSLFGDSQL